jgi:hypothetical protein
VLTDFMMGPQPVSDNRSTGRAISVATEAGFDVIDLRQETLRTFFYDVGAVVYFPEGCPGRCRASRLMPTEVSSL